ncbi:MAG: zinc ribbon-containing protein [Methylovulum sp.]|uniref:zinc ribbon-containing protein n=1 Tax=Methylovulum sp. TaxID=1916980 RepID=UPI0026128E4F|nr:zinc ribbon-containing protein [Methylovulum sp.]MDD2722712.1 zinc ribbon-containing protein [Methylovulum sp.]MDD5125196.1 zinc ribbon-containing protein [Methylovulum sp.]
MNKNKLINAYLELMGHLYEAMDDTLHSSAEAMDVAKGKLSKVSDLTSEEMDKVAGYLKRDVEHAAHWLSDHTDFHSLSDWFKFDVDLVENFTLDAFASLADKTRIELAKLEQLATKHVYHSGDITSPGTFICDDCGKEIAFKTPSEIPECPACHHNVFVRM